MNSNVRGLTSVPRINPAEQIAAGLEEIAREVRAGSFPFPITRCLIVVSGPDAGRTDNVGLTFFGADCSLAETVGLLELAKFQAMEEG